MQRRYREAAPAGWFGPRLSPDHRRWRDRWRGRRFIRVRLQTNAGSLGRHEGFGVTGKCAAGRPSVVCDRALGDDATIGVDANLALDPVVSNLDNPADASNSVRSRLAGLRRIQPLGVSDGLGEVYGMIGVWIAAARDLLAETSLERC